MEATDKKHKKEKTSWSILKKKKEEEGEAKEITITILGALQVGKSAFANQYYYRRFQFEYQPTISHSFSKTVENILLTFILARKITQFVESFKFFSSPLKQFPTITNAESKNRLIGNRKLSS